MSMMALVTPNGPSAPLLTFDRCSIDINPPDINEAAPAMAASRHEIGESDLVDSAQIGLRDPAPDFRWGLPLGMYRRDGVDVETEPADRSNRELCLDEVLGRAVAVGVITNEPRAVGELQDWADNVESRRACLPADLCPSGKVHKIVLVAKGGRHRSVTDPGPQVRRILPVVRGRRRDLNLLR